MWQRRWRLRMLTQSPSAVPKIQSRTDVTTLVDMPLNSIPATTTAAAVAARVPVR